MDLVQRIETISATAIEREGEAAMAIVGDEILPLIGAEGIAANDPKVRLLRLSDGNGELLDAVSVVDDAAVLNGEMITTRLEDLRVVKTWLSLVRSRLASDTYKKNTK